MSDIQARRASRSAIRRNLRELKSLLLQRPDSEHGQVFVRFFMCLLAGIVLIEGFGSTPAVKSNPQLLTLMWLGMTLAIVQFGLILRNPGVSHARRIFAIIYDYGAMTIAMLVAPEPTAFLYVVMMWVTVGYGLRYGNRYLIATVIIASVCFGTVIASSPFWHAIQPLPFVMLLGLIMVPSYACGLLLGTHRHTRRVERAAKERTRALANASHEFKTALNTIALQSDLLGSDLLDEEGRRNATRSIGAAAQVMLAVSRSIMGLSELETNPIRITPIRFNMKSMLSNVESIVKPLAVSKELPISFSVTEQAYGDWIADEAHLKQVLINLISNAIKYTDSGSVQVILDVRSTNLQHLLHVEVADTGVGIPAEVQSNLFTPFMRGFSNSKRNIEGTGLGLHICKQSITAMGGTIDVITSQGCGTIFKFEVPLAKPAVVATESSISAVKPCSSDLSEYVREHQRRTSPLTIMVVDDMESTRLVLKTILTKCGHEAISFDSPEKALDALATGSVHFDLALVDFQMPEMNGIEFAKHAAVLSTGDQTRLPIYLITAGIGELTAYKKELRQFAGIIEKPMSCQKLLNAIEAYVESAPSGGRQHWGSGDGRRKSKYSH